MRDHRAEILAVATIFAVSLLIRIPTLDQPLVEANTFRQTQTAFTARIFHEEGIDLLHPQLPVLGEPWEVPFEFPLFQAAASLTMSLGLSPDVALRTTGLLMFLVTAGLIYGLVRYATRQPVAAGAALVAFSLSPFALVWSRTSMIEYMATAGAVGFAFAGIVWLDNRRWFWAAIAMGAGIVGMLVKPTTAAFWVLPILGWTIGRSSWPGWPGWNDRLLRWAKLTLRPGLLAILAIPFLAGFIWTRHADAIKGASRLSEWLTESALRSWNFGTIDQRLDLRNWLRILRNGHDLLVGPIVWGLLLLLPLIDRKRRWFWIGIALTAVLPIVVFFNLYRAHDYYLAAVSPSVAMLLGAGIAWLSERVSPSLDRTTKTVGAFALGTAWLASILLTTVWYWREAYREVHSSRIAAEVSEVTAPRDRLVVVGDDWSPHTLYYADRRGVMLTPHLNPSETLAEVRRRNYEYLVAVAPAKDPIHYVRAWPWIGVVSEHVYRLGNEIRDVTSAAIVATSHVDALNLRVSSGKKLMGARSLSCDVPQYLPQGRVATWIRVSPQQDPKARLWFGSDLAPLPAVAAMVVITRDTEEPLVMRCTGAESVEIESIVSGSVPES